MCVKTIDDIKYSYMTNICNKYTINEHFITITHVMMKLMHMFEMQTVWHISQLGNVDLKCWICFLFLENL